MADFRWRNPDQELPGLRVDDRNYRSSDLVLVCSDTAQIEIGWLQEDEDGVGWRWIENEESTWFNAIAWAPLPDPPQWAKRQASTSEDELERKLIEALQVFVGRGVDAGLVVEVAAATGRVIAEHYRDVPNG